jgi:hypothetical protein
MVSIQIKGDLAGLNRTIGRIDGRFKMMSMSKFGTAVARKARQILLLKLDPKRSSQRTGELENSITTVSVTRGSAVAVVAEAYAEDGTEYGAIIEGGHLTKKIRPANGAYMYLPKFGPYSRRVKMVRGIKSRHFMAEAAEWADKQIVPYVNKRVARILKSDGHVDDYSIETTIV